MHLQCSVSDLRSLIWIWGNSLSYHPPKNLLLDPPLLSATMPLPTCYHSLHHEHRLSYRMHVKDIQDGILLERLLKFSISDSTKYALMDLEESSSATGDFLSSSLSHQTAVYRHLLRHKMLLTLSLHLQHLLLHSNQNRTAVTFLLLQLLLPEK